MRILVVFIFLFIHSATAQQAKKVLQTQRVSVAPKIDGKLEDEAWQNVMPASDFIMREPYQNVPASQRSEVRIIYDDEAIYIAAKLYDSAPDSILKELSIRDNYGNTDWFSVHFDTFHDLQNRFEFGVTAAGVQFDEKTGAEVFDVVWESDVRITKEGWNVEMKIPYAALRFPEKSEQVWGLQFRRNIRRARELDLWQYVSPDIQNVVSYYGEMQGISNIKSPLRLSLTPYVGLEQSHYPYNVAGKSNWSSSYNAGLDLKYGINESFTLDMTLAPDFGQVQSDNQVLNLSAFEIQFQEFRPFFIEGTELFNLPNLFYARRIGGRPRGYFGVEALTSDSSVRIIDNPQQVQLINATKVTGRTPQGLGLGFLNAVTAETTAKYVDETGVERKVQTEPLTNYNAVSFNQTLKNNSSVSFMNTNVTRFNFDDDANVSALNVVIGEKKDRFRFSGFGAYSRKTFGDSVSNGYAYNLGLDKVSGNWKFGYNVDVMSERYDPNDMGILFFANQISHGTYVRYDEYKPSKYFLRYSVNVNGYYSTTFVGNKFQEFQLNLNYNHTWRNWLTQWAYIGVQPVRKNDFYEPREEGRVFLGPTWYGGSTGISSDYRKKFALDAQVGYFRDFTAGGVFNDLSITPIIRFSDKLKFSYTFYRSDDYNNQGYSTRVDSHIYFAFRQVKTYTNTMNVSYIFGKNTALTFRARHYWSTVEVLEYKLLQDDGNLGFDTTNFAGNNNFNVNFFNIDLIYRWRFAPGSDLIFVWKNSINTFDRSLLVEPHTGDRLVDSFINTVTANQTNSFNIKVLYFLDYRSVMKPRSKPVRPS
jgi:hypothetical protein